MSAAHPRKHALLIGINQYPGFDATSQLSGALHDVELMASVLEEIYGFARHDLTILRDGEATRAGILAAMQKLLERVRENDIVVFHYSGHGSQAPSDDTLSGLCETLVPHDSGRGSYPVRDIYDREIFAWLLRLVAKTPHVSLIFDSCHSATAARDSGFAPKVRRVPAAVEPAEPVALPWQLPPRRDARAQGTSAWLPPSDKYTVIAACLDDESAFEKEVLDSDEWLAVGGGSWRDEIEEAGKLSFGALSFHLCRELIRARPGATFREVFTPVGLAVTSEHRFQHPQLEGRRDSVVFGVEDVIPMRFALVDSRDGDHVMLRAGAAHGMRRASEWRLYPPGTRQPEEAEPLGLVKVEGVGATRARARILAEEAPIDAGARAVEVSHMFDDMRLAVEVVGPTEKIAGILAKIDKSPLLRHSPPGLRGDVRLYWLAPRAVVAATDPVPQLGAASRPRWAVVGGDGMLAMPWHYADHVSSVARTLANLEARARYLSALQLENPDPASPLAGQIELYLEQRDDRGEWQELSASPGSERIRLREGDKVAIEIFNAHTQPLYVAVLDFGLSGRIEQIYPPPGAVEPLPPNGVLTLGHEDDELTLYIPEQVPFDKGYARGEEIEGLEVIKVFATTAEADFTVFRQVGFRTGSRPATDREPSLLEQLLAMAVHGHGRRETRQTRNLEADDWTTAQISFSLTGHRPVAVSS